MTFRQPAEWAEHQACWLAWPSHADLWLESLPAVRDAFVSFAAAIADPHPETGAPRGERLEVLVLPGESEDSARERLKGLPVRFHAISFGDIWLRDTAPVFLTDGEGGLAAACFDFNGWGGKYVLPGDAEVAVRVAEASRLPFRRLPFVLEGGSVEVDGLGTCLTTRQCLLNPNRNPDLSRAELEERVNAALGTERLLWLNVGLLNDHTDGHVDTVARFVAPGVVVCMEARNDEDPNRDALEEIRRDLAEMRDASGRRLEVVSIPSPGLILDGEGEVMPASYVNFYLANTSVTVPVYGSPFDDEAVAAIASLFPTRRAVAVSARELLEGGGAFHCISQQVPAGRP